MEINKYNTHIVLKVEDCLSFLTVPEQKKLQSLINKIVDGRKENGKDEASYYICNTDEPYADEVKKIILVGEAAKKTLADITNTK